jgi:hypothetical protein
VGQDFRALAKVIDVFNPMSYHVLNQRPAAWIGDVNQHLVRVTGRPVWPFVIFDKDKTLAPGQWNEVFRHALAGGAGGFIAFPYQNIWRSSGENVLVEFLKKSAGVRP